VTEEECRRLALRLNATNVRPREAGRALLTLAGIKLDLRVALEGEQATAADAVSEMLAECEHWKTCWSHEHVDKDRQVRAALAKSADCEHHGTVIATLEARTARISAALDRTDSARVALLGLLHWLDRFIGDYDVAVKLDRPVMDGPDIVMALRSAVKRTSAAHQRVWSDCRERPASSPRRADNRGRCNATGGGGEN
jgi:hypothetical protein